MARPAKAGAEVGQVAFHEFATHETGLRGVPVRRLATADGGMEYFRMEVYYAAGSVTLRRASRERSSSRACSRQPKKLGCWKTAQAASAQAAAAGEAARKARSAGTAQARPVVLGMGVLLSLRSGAPVRRPESARRQV